METSFALAIPNHDYDDEEHLVYVMMTYYAHQGPLL